MSSLTKKIDFVLFISVKDANPNGDPLLGNMPRTDYDDYGEMSDVCIKRKIRNRLQNMGNEIFVKSDECIDDGFKSLQERYENTFKNRKDDKIESDACKEWIDVRSFGQVIAFHEGESIGIRGPVSISIAKSLSPINITSMQITKSTNGKKSNTGKRSSDRMGTKHFVDFGVYRIEGSINCYFAKKTGFSDEDAQKIKKACRTLFINDMSSARPEGSMAVEKLFWFTHPNESGVASSAKIHQLVSFSTLQDAKSFADYKVHLREDKVKYKGLEVEVLDGE